MAKVFPLHLHPGFPLKGRLNEAKSAFVAEHLSFFVLALDAAARLGGPSPQGVQVLERASELLHEATRTLLDEFDLLREEHPS